MVCQSGVLGFLLVSGILGFLSEKLACVLISFDGNRLQSTEQEAQMRREIDGSWSVYFGAYGLFMSWVCSATRLGLRGAEC